MTSEVTVTVESATGLYTAILEGQGWAVAYNGRVHIARKKVPTLGQVKYGIGSKRRPSHRGRKGGSISLH